MLKVIQLQVVIVCLVAVLVSPWLGGHGFVSVMAGGAAYILPNMIFVIRLRLVTGSDQANAATFFVGELFKVLATIALLAVAHQWLDVHWLAMLIGLFAALKANLFAFLLKT